MWKIKIGCRCAALAPTKGLRVVLLVAANFFFLGSVASQAALSPLCQSVDRATVLNDFVPGLSSSIVSKYARHFRDQTNKTYPDPIALERSPLTISSHLEIRGTTEQLGIFPGPYRYDVDVIDGVAVISVRTYLKNATSADRAEVQSRLEAAAATWNASRPRYPFDYRFEFTLVDSPTLAHFRVSLKDNTRGPYFMSWGRDPVWDSGIQAHEMGHTMGLADEYEGLVTDELSSEKACDHRSPMCDRRANQFQPIHYYMILRRIATASLGCATRADDESDNSGDDSSDDKELDMNESGF